MSYRFGFREGTGLLGEFESTRITLDSFMSDDENDENGGDIFITPKCVTEDEIDKQILLLIEDLKKVGDQAKRSMRKRKSVL